jgi:hypothetical protein
MTLIADGYLDIVIGIYCRVILGKVYWQTKHHHRRLGFQDYLYEASTEFRKTSGSPKRRRRVI